MKAIIFDADGMVILGERFSDRYKKDFGVPDEDTRPFFAGPFQDCSAGRADLKKMLGPFIKKWKWKKSLNEFLRYWFSGNSLDAKMIKQIERFRKRGIKCYLATNQEKYRTRYIKKELGLEKVFDKIYVSCDVGYPKSSREFFDFVSNDLRNKEGVDPANVMYWDDKGENLPLAKEFGFDSYLYGDFDNFKLIVRDI